MPKYRGESAVGAPPTGNSRILPGSRAQRLVAALADLVPGARTLRVSQRQPGQPWPSPVASAYDAEGRPLALNPTQRVTAARWVIRVHPDVSWNEAHELDLRTGTLRPTEARLAMSGGR